MVALGFEPPRRGRPRKRFRDQHHRDLRIAQRYWEILNAKVRALAFEAAGVEQKRLAVKIRKLQARGAPPHKIAPLVTALDKMGRASAAPIPKPAPGERAQAAKAR
jgi:hypothetical protein